MTATRASASLFFASALTGFSALSGTLTAPFAHADPLDNIRGAVIAARANTGCPPLNNNGQLEAAAQAWVRVGGTNNGNSAGYVGVTVGDLHGEDKAEDATNNVLVHLSDQLHDCNWKDYGVGMERAADESTVAVFLGQPPAPAPAAPAPANNAPANNTNTGGDAKQQAEPPAPPPKDGVTMDIDQSDSTKVAVTVTNTSPLDGNCTYDAKKTAGLIGQQDVNKTFSLAPGAGTTLTFPAVPVGSTYHVVVSCHGTFNGQDDEFGRKEQDVSAKL